MEFYDNTQVSTFRDCRRRFYYRHEKHWTGEGVAVAPGFGIAMHKACDSIWEDASTLPKDQLNLGTMTKKAWGAFMRAWEEEGLPDDDDLRLNFKPTYYDRYNTANAAEMIRQYILDRIEFIRSVEVLAIERPFVVPLYPNRTDVMYCGRMDKIIRNARGIYVIDHKTTSSYAKDGGFQNSFLESFSPDNQIDGYAYGAMMLYGNEFKGCLIDAILVHKKERRNTFIPVDRVDAHLDDWLHSTRREIENIQAERAILDGVHESAPFLPAYSKNTHRCYDFNSPCPYTDFCKCLPNPHFHPTPLGFKVEEWSPFDKNDIAQLGITEG